MGKVLHASYSGYFPFCIYEGNLGQVGSGTAFPLGMSLENAMLLYWKIKSFKLTAPSSSKTAIVQSPKSSEEQIVCGNNFFIGGVEDSLNPGNPNSYLRVTDLILFTSIQLIKVQDTYYPNLVIGFVDDAYGSSGEATKSGAFSSYDPEGDLSLYGYFNFLGIGNVDLFTNLGGIVGSPQFGNIEIEEYWPYQ